jgi:peroxiredoxin
MTIQLKSGNAAPAFETWDVSGTRRIDLSSYRGRHVLLSFYRYASCPLCNLRVHDLAKKHADWHWRGLDMLAVFQSPADKMRQYVGGQHTPFPLIPDPDPDPDQKLYALYGVGHSWAGFLKAWGTRLPEIGRSVMGKGYLPGSVEGGIHRIPADFVIDPHGRIAEAFYGQDIGDHLPVERIEAYLQEQS